MNRFIPTTVHGYLNYLVSAISIASPWLFGFSDAHGAALFVPMYFGVLQMVLSIFTNYEAGAIKSAPLELHLALDVFFGFFVMISPFLWDFADVVFWPHILIGGYTLFTGLFTEIKSFHGFGYFKATA